MSPTSTACSRQVRMRAISAGDRALGGWRPMIERQRRRRRPPSASSTGRSAGRGRPLPAPDDRLRAIRLLAVSWSRRSDAAPQMQARPRKPMRHQSVRRRVVRSLSDLSPPARRSHLRQCDRLSRGPRRIDRASGRSLACAGSSGPRGWYAAAIVVPVRAAASPSLDQTDGAC